MNDKGLVANVLYLVESDYGKASYIVDRSLEETVLDNYATVDEAVEGLRKEPFVIIAPMRPNKVPAHGHLGALDPTGDSAIFEYLGGRLVIHHSRKYQVMTNSPAFDQQL